MADDDLFAAALGAAGLGGVAYYLMTQKCSGCGKRNPKENDRCNNCGAFL